MTLDDLERQNRGFYDFFRQFRVAIHFKSDFVKINKHGEGAYEIFSIKRRF